MPVITVSRQDGSEGDLVAKMVAERLGFVFLDRAAMVSAAQQEGMSINKALVPEIDEKKPSFWERLDEERRRYNLLLRYLVYDFARRDQCVIVGHGAEAFLAGLNHILRVKLIAPFDTRVKRVMERDRLPKDAAVSAVRQSDRERAGYMKYLFQEDWLNPELYDLVLNTEKLRPETVVGLIVQAAAIQELSPSAASLQVLGDRALASRVEMRLLLDPRIGSTGLRVLSSRGEVTLSGTLATDEEKEIAEMVAGNTPGVNRLISELVVVPITSTLYP